MRYLHTYFFLMVLLPVLCIGCGGLDLENSYDGGNGICFAGHTNIATPSGDRRVDELRLGEEVVTYDKKTESMKVGVVESVKIRTSEQILEIKFSDDSTVLVTEEHPILYDGEFRKAGELETGSIVPHWRAGQGFVNVSITSIRELDWNDRVYNLKVRHYYTYVAEGLVAHFY